MFFQAIEILGTISFAISGAMAGVRKGADLFGVLFLGILTATGGGILRDILLGALPPRIFFSGQTLLIAGLSALALFLVAWRMKGAYAANEERVDAINNIFDALGLGVFSITGAQVAAAAGHGSNLFFMVLLGMMTGTGGGIIRDVLVNELPSVLKKHIYALASMLGALTYALLEGTLLSTNWAAVVGILLVFAVRMLATHYRWNLPKA